tara:strand:- start:146 stop:520 length:375 start_codon:yes stop_codon:yes gene_type:complete
MKIKKRPELSSIVHSGTLKFERFQNESIRPIIKMQHDILIIMFQNYLIKKKLDFTALEEVKQKEHINSIVTKDIVFKNLIIGVVIGQFSKIELNFFFKNSVELKKRIIQIIKYRLYDNFILIQN